MYHNELQANHINYVQFYLIITSLMMSTNDEGILLT